MKILWTAPKAIFVGLTVAAVSATVFLLWHVILGVLLLVIAWRVFGRRLFPRPERRSRLGGLLGRW